MRTITLPLGYLYALLFGTISGFIVLGMLAGWQLRIIKDSTQVDQSTRQIEELMDKATTLCGGEPEYFFISLTEIRWGCGG